MIENIYNKWQLQDIDLGNTEPYQFTKSELLNFAEFYHKEKANKKDSVNFHCVNESYNNLDSCKNQCVRCKLKKINLNNNTRKG